MMQFIFVPWAHFFMDMREQFFLKKFRQKVIIFAAMMGACASLFGAPAVALKPQAKVCVIGNTFAERLVYDGQWETLLHARFPQHQLVVRNFAWSADTITSWKDGVEGQATQAKANSHESATVKPRQYRPSNCPTLDEFLTQYEADVIFACYGQMETFESPLPVFRQDVAEFIDHVSSQIYNGNEPPTLALVSPLATEDIGQAALPAAAERNRVISTYVAAMKEVCAEKSVPFIDLFTPSAQAYEASRASQNPLTINSLHLNEKGQAVIGRALDEALFGPRAGDTLSSDQLQQLRREVNEKNHQFFLRYRPVNPYYVYGGRAAPFGVESFPPEMTKLSQMVQNRDRRIWEAAQGKALPEKIDDSNTLQLEPIPTNIKETITYLSAENALKDLQVKEGYEVSLFASEEQFPELAKPVQFAFDARGRLWVSTMPSYPQVLPGAVADDKIIILEDTDRDGKADKCTTFADKLYLPLGLELGDGGVYVSQQPNLMHIKDTNGDDRADTRDLILHGFGTEDSHHALSVFVWDQGGALYFTEGTFHHTQVETPHGPTRLIDSGCFRFEPQRQKLDVWVSYSFANPWGLTFGRWGQSLLADASGGANYFATAFSGALPYPQKHLGMNTFTPREMLMRPTAGCEFVSSRHWKEEDQDKWLLCNCIGFQGVAMYTLDAKGSGYEAVKKETLLQAKDKNFRPVDLEFAPDGSLYVLDWHNALVGHMQHSLRDPNRDHKYGRIYRLTAKDRPLVQAPAIAEQPIPALLEALRVPENRTRDQVRLALRQHPKADVIAQTQAWAKNLTGSDSATAHLLCEALWVQQHHDVLDLSLLDRLLKNPEPLARAAAVRTFRFYHERIADIAIRLKAAALDEHPLVRLEAVVAASYLPTLAGVEAALAATQKDMDYYLTYALNETMRTLDPVWKDALAQGKTILADNPAGQAYLIKNMSDADLIRMPQSEPVLSAMLLRAGISAADRQKALQQLAQLKNQPVSRILAETLQQSDGGGGAAELRQLLLDQPAAELKTLVPQLSALAERPGPDLVRGAAFAAIIAAEGQTAPAWKIATSSPTCLQAFLGSLGQVKDAALREQVFASVLSIARGQLPAEVSQENRPTQGRYVRISLPRPGIMHLAEVFVMSGGKNVAPGRPATQSSTGYNAPATRAVDGNIGGGEFGRNSMSHTAENDEAPWWEVDLGALVPIDSIVVHNRTDLRTDIDLFMRLDGYRLAILDGSRQVVFEQKDIRAQKTPQTIETNRFDPLAVQRAALSALSHFQTHEAERTEVLIAATNQPETLPASVPVLAHMSLTTAQAPALEAALSSFIKNTPLTQRSQEIFTKALVVAKKVGLNDLVAQEMLQEIPIESPPLSFKFQPAQLTAKAGRPAVIVYHNPDDKPHNLLIVAPDKLEETITYVETNAASLIDKEFIPDSPKPLVASRMVQAGETYRLYFTVPSEPGAYPFVCTYPGHGRLMNGVLTVEAAK
jgi:glucose/arabinose dehydrogenase/plastocyanin